MASSPDVRAPLLFRKSRGEWPKRLLHMLDSLLDEHLRKYREADYWAADAMMSVRLCQLIMKGSV